MFNGNVTHMHKCVRCVDARIPDDVTVGAKVYVMVPTVCGSSEWYLRHVAILVPRVLRWFLCF